MPRGQRKRESEFHKSLQGSAHETLKKDKTRAAIEIAVAAFGLESPESKDWELLCDIRDHVNAMIGVHRDLDQARSEGILADVRDGKYKDRPKDAQAALNDLNTCPFTVADYYAEIDRQGIPEY